MNMIEFKVPIPEGMEIDKEKSTFECIKFKPIKKRWRDNEGADVTGYYINSRSDIRICVGLNKSRNYNVFATEKQAKAALAMARISQIMANDERFGGVVTGEEWNRDEYKSYICRVGDYIGKPDYMGSYCFLAFHTKEQRDLFLEENEDLVKDYLMME